MPRRWCTAAGPTGLAKPFGAVTGQAGFAGDLLGTRRSRDERRQQQNIRPRHHHHLAPMRQNRTTETPSSPRQFKERAALRGRIANLLDGEPGDLLPEAMRSTVFLVSFVPWWFILCHIRPRAQCGTVGNSHRPVAYRLPPAHRCRDRCRRTYGPASEALPASGRISRAACRQLPGGTARSRGQPQCAFRAGSAPAQTARRCRRCGS